ncbi:hypothetical protein [Taibaiella soli]|uniref:Lipocalin-like domain-containing protein n=1 Tax=Taibaiella soli TaxID=1649169 RepID=A0A2W2AH52_9BACT|nr:hypothetical protein [Taibaiella soli]PZF74601.1 hypothetical protein DN068_03215 [Taibaiella soli]
MKKLLLCPVCAISLLSCKKDDGPSTDKNKLLGKWSQTFDVSTIPGQVPDTFYYDPNKPFIWDYEPEYVISIVPNSPPDTSKYSLSGTTLNWLDSNGNAFLKQDIDVLNDTMLVLSQHSTQGDVLSVLKKM